MARVLRREPLPNGMTAVTVDFDGEHTATVQLVTATAHTLTDAQVASLVADMVTVQRPPIRKGK